MILKSQKDVCDKVRIRYKPKNKQKLLKIFFIKPSFLSMSSHTICFSHGRIGYKAYACKLNKFDDKIVKKIWILKEILINNLKDPKKFEYLNQLLDCFIGIFCNR